MSDKKNNETAFIEPMPNGPLIVKGLTRLLDSAGNQVDHEKDVIALCRCGESTNKPYCDGSHSGAGFSSDREISRPLTRSKAYKGKRITINDNRTICAHAAECVNNLPAVFKMENRPWINPDGADVETIIETIKKCPSGALSYTIGDVLHEEKNLDPEILIQKDGPYNIRGRIELKDSDDIQPPNRELYSLCRCGASKNKPYCDGMHHEIGFKD